MYIEEFLDSRTVADRRMLDIGARSRKRFVTPYRLFIAAILSVDGLDGEIFVFNTLARAHHTDITLDVLFLFHIRSFSFLR